jgi:hypothetical protein
MKTFYTDHDIEDMAKAGTREIEVDDDVVLTDLAREKALRLGIKLRKRPLTETVVASRPPLIRPPAGAATGGFPSSSPATAELPARTSPERSPMPLSADSSPASAIPASQSSAAPRKPSAAAPAPTPPASLAAGSLSEDEFKQRVKSAIMARLGSGVSEAMIDAAIVKVLKQN